MLISLKIFFDILFFSKGPQDLPSSTSLLNLVILANLLIGLISLNPDIDVTINILFAIIYVVVTSLFIKIALGIKDKNDGFESDSNGSYSGRYLQVCTGTLGVHVLIAIFTSLLTILFGSSGSIIIYVFLALSLYAWFVNGHIFRNAFDTSMMLGLGISMLHSFACVFFMMLLLQLLI